jgi:hypothetical protein
MAFEEGAMGSPGREHDAARKAPGGAGDRPWPDERPSDVVGDELPTYRARELAPYRRRDAGLYDSGLTGRYPGLRGSGARDPRIKSTGPGPGMGTDADPDRAAMLSGRIVIVATIVVGQLWGLTVLLNSWIERRTDQVWLLLAFQLLSLVVALAVWRATPRDR